MLFYGARISLCLVDSFILRLTHSLKWYLFCWDDLNILRGVVRSEENVQIKDITIIRKSNKID